MMYIEPTVTEITLDERQRDRDLRERRRLRKIEAKRRQRGDYR